MTINIIRCFPKPDRAQIADQLRRVADGVSVADDTGLLRMPEGVILEGLNDTDGDALSRVVQLLACGEQSAIHVFYKEGDRLGQGGSPLLQSQSIMYRIAKEETLHDEVLSRLAHLLPYDERHQALRRYARRFYVKLAHPDPKYHFFRISELDSVVCMIMHSLLTGTGKVRNKAGLAAIVQRIRNDEATHVRITRDRVAELGMTVSERLTEADPVRAEIVAMLGTAADAFEILGIDADALFRRIMARRVK